jgi:hypothetical protein
VFAGVVGKDDHPVLADLTYQGITHVGGEIEGDFRLRNGLNGVMKVEATLGVGGTYRGFRGGR